MSQPAARPSAIIFPYYKFIFHKSLANCKEYCGTCQLDRSHCLLVLDKNCNIYILVGSEAFIRISKHYVMFSQLFANQKLQNRHNLVLGKGNIFYISLSSSSRSIFWLTRTPALCGDQADCAKAPTLQNWQYFDINDVGRRRDLWRPSLASPRTILLYSISGLWFPISL